MKIIATATTKLLAASALALTVAGCAHQKQAPTPVATTQVAAETKEAGGPALWKVADEDTTIYLFGTVHALPEGVDWFKGDIADALASSEALVTEIYVPKGSEGTIAQAFAAKGTLPEGTSLRDTLEEKDRATYEAALAKIGLPAQAFDRQEPWLAAVTLSLIPLFQVGYTPEAGVEKVIEEKAGDKTRIELESVDFQVAMLDDLPVESQEQYLISVASGIDEIVPTLTKIVDEWAVGDVEGLDELMNVDYGDPLITDAIFVSRNKTWAGWIDDRLDDPGTIFVAVGAGHLAGDQSVQAALAERGIVTTRVQ